MKWKSSLLVVCILFCVFPVLAREVLPFNTDWQFKKGPFPTDAMKAFVWWAGKWESVTLPHTWNAKDMQQRSNSFYQGVAYYRKNYFSRKHGKESDFSFVLRELAVVPKYM